MTDTNALAAQADELSKALDSLQTKFESSQQDYNVNQLETQKALVTATGQGMEALKGLAVLLDGEFDPTHPPTGLDAAVQKSNAAWQAAEEDAGKCWDVISKFSVLMAQFHAELGSWQSKTESLKSDVDAQRNATQQAMQAASATMDSLNQNLDVLRNTLNDLKNRRDQKQREVDTASTVTIFLPVARLALEAINAVIQATTHDIENTQNAINDTERQLAAIESGLQQLQSHLNSLNNVAAIQARISGKGTELLSRSQELQAAVEAAQKSIADIKNRRMRSHELINKLLARAEMAKFALTKADYGTTVLQVAEVALGDSTLHQAVADVVTQLATHDDHAGSIHGIKTDEHPDGLLAALEAKLGQGSGTVHVARLLSAAPTGIPSSSHSIISAIAAQKLDEISPEQQAKISHVVRSLYL